MACDIHATPGPSLAGLVSGILRDAQDLVRQEVTLAKVEIGQELRKTKEAALSVLAGVAFLVLGAIFLLLMVVYLISWATGGNIPVWGSYAIVGGVLALIGAILVYSGRNRAEKIHLVPKQTVETLRENMQWMTNPR